ncbi:RNase J family beta-CASP ribonuclease [Candidatus Woesearchaeota archaeon]|jgi:ribonuclease J|nr:RNase J family beta-CASP ribonuclease [Candidatus Woesearchaeota archaeon]MBT5740454.1 RNase J family beta-CASP ribonuclease [Candidatus Woesearchaeota archaeon]
MSIEICTIGGFSEVGRNSTAIKVDDEVVILDMGLHMENYIRHTEDSDVRQHTAKELLAVEAVPNYDLIKDWKNVVGIVPSHGHLDHIGAIPFMAPLFPKVPIVCTPYTAEVIRRILKDERIKTPNKIISVNPNSTYQLSKKITIELVNITHSIPHAALIVVHTPYGKLVYANDYKIDRQPTLGKKPNFARMKAIGQEKPLALFIESLYANAHKKTPSEAVAKQMLKDVMLGVHAEGKGMIVTTFSSHLARLKSIIEFGKKLNRKIVFIGRSLSKYVKAGETVGIVNFTQDIEIVSHRDKVEKMLRRIMREGKEKYLIVCTGHQGEPRAVLSRLGRGEHHYKFSPGDLVVFSCQVIPVKVNKENRSKLENNLKSHGVRLFTEIHVSGHASREDHRDLIEMIQPQHIIPSHAGPDKTKFMAELAKEMGYDKKHIHIMADGKRLKLS